MNKKFLSVILFSALMVGTAGTFTSCKDYDDDIDQINNESVSYTHLVSVTVMEECPMASDMIPGCISQ